MIGTVIQHYRIIRQLGVGGMGVVYEAEDTRLGRHVALKFLPETLAVAPEMADRFEREARIASSLNHPNICTIYDIGVDAEHGHRRYIVMELLEGESLRARIDGHPLPLDTILDVGCQLADALDAAHAKGIVHRDIKPANIFITRRGQAKLLDFGVAKLGGDRHTAAGEVDETRVSADVLTTPGTAVGSVNYMSPEQARGEEIDARTDLFSLGLVLYEMATGRQAFTGQTTAVVFEAILNRDPPAPRLGNPAVPEDLERVILRALEKDRRLRYQTAADMLAELARVRRDTSGRTAAVASPTAAGAVTSSVRVGDAPPAPSTAAAASARRPRWLTVGVPGVVIAGVAAYYAWHSTRTPAFAERDMVVVADFANTTGDAVFDDALKQAVSVQLQQTPFVTLLPDQRIQGTLRLMQRPPEQPLTGEVAREVCQRTGSRATVEGSIAPLGSSYVIALGVHNCQTGESLAQQQVQAKSKEDVLAALGGAITDLRKHLGESLASIQKYDVPVTDATTSSLEALRAYGLANKTRATKGDEASAPFFQQAIDKDPNFALAYAKLGVVYSNLGRVDDAKRLAAKAYEFKDRVSEYERLYITWNNATRVLKDDKLARETLELMTASYPRDFAARNNLGVYYIEHGQFEDALAQYQAAIAIAPDEPQPQSNATSALLFLGRYDEAFKMADRALALRPNASLNLSRWVAAVLIESPRAAEFEAAARKAAPPDQMLAAEAAVALWHGKIGEYQRLQEELRAKARAAHNDAQLASIDANERITLAAFLGGRYMDALKASIGQSISPVILAQSAAALATFGYVKEARAALPRLEPEARNNEQVRLPLTVLQAYAQAADGHPREAIAELEAALHEFPRALDFNFHIGRIRERSGDAKGAEANYRSILNAMPVLGLNAIIEAARMSLGELLLSQGNTAGAKEMFDALLKQWRDADTEFELLKRARDDRAKIKD